MTRVTASSTQPTLARIPRPLRPAMARSPMAARARPGASPIIGTARRKRKASPRRTARSAARTANRSCGSRTNAERWPRASLGDLGAATGRPARPPRRNAWKVGARIARCRPRCVRSESRKPKPGRILLFLRITRGVPKLRTLKFLMRFRAPRPIPVHAPAKGPARQRETAGPWVAGSRGLEVRGGS